MSYRLNITVDRDLKDKVAKLYNDLGMSLSTAVNTFFKQSLRERAMPFRPSEEQNPIPTKETEEALEELKHPEKLKSYSNAREMMKDILNDK